ncbi:MAG: hypothetical protein WEA61_00355 [Anaerolineales bacterium]
MQLRCMHCYTPFTLSQEGVMAALDEVEAKGFKYYNAYCPRCGRPNMVPKPQLEREAPGWAPRTIAMQPVTAPVAGGPKPAHAASKPAPTATAKSAAKKTAAKPKPAAKKAAPKTKAAKKPAKKAAAKKAAPKKPSKAKATKAKSIAKKKTAKKK